MTDSTSADQAPRDRENQSIEDLNVEALNSARFQPEEQLFASRDRATPEQILLEQMLIEQRHLLERIASGHPLEECLSAVCASISRLNPRVRACFLLADTQQFTLSRLIAPGFLPSFEQRLRGTPINELCTATCREAMFQGEPVTCADIANDNRWAQQWQNLCIAHGVLAWHAQPVMGSNGAPIGALLLCFDEARMPSLWERQLAEFGAHVASIVFERDRSTMSLRDSESRFRLMVESAREYAIFTLDLNGIITSWNSGAQRLLQYEESEILGHHFRTVFTPEDLEHGRDQWEMQTALAEGQAENERWHVRKDGTRFWGSGLSMLLRDADDNVEGFIKIMRDETPQRQAQARFQLLYDTTSDLLATEQPLTLMDNLFDKLADQLALDHYYNYLTEEKDGRSILHLSYQKGLSPEAAQAIEWVEFGESLCGLVAQERRQIVFDQAQLSSHPNACFLCAAGVTAYAGQPLIVRGRLLGTLSFASRTRTRFTPEEASLLQTVCDQMAIALERTNLMRSIQQQAEQLERANQIKDEFLAVLSHELRSPLNPILGWAKLLKQGKLDAARTQSALDTIERNAQLQTQLIDDLLDISRILRGKLSLNVAPVDLRTVISEATETVQLAAEAKSLNIQTALPPTSVTVMGDGGRLQQVVWNLLSNAVKFTPQGGQITISLAPVATESGTGGGTGSRAGSAAENRTNAQIVVTDTGKGIKPEFLPYVFEHFRQEDGATTRKFGGLGLGLAIVKQIVELHGGRAFVTSPGEGQGATFGVQIPLAPALNEQPALADSGSSTGDLTGLHVLAVDDDADSRELITFVLEQAGASLTCLTSAHEALQAIERSSFDLIVSDIGMPDIDGYTLLQQIRSYSPTSELPAIALTAYAGEFNRQQALAAGFQYHLAKPVDPTEMVNMVARLCERQGGNA
jgi:PAS domain S-box-containing protein